MGNNTSNPMSINVNHNRLFYFTDELIEESVNLNVTQKQTRN